MPETSKTKKDAHKAKKLTEVTEDELNRVSGGSRLQPWDVSKVTDMVHMVR